MSQGLSWSTAVDTRGFEEGMNRIEQSVQEASANIEIESSRIQSLLTDIPEVDINFVTNMPQTADQIGEAYAMIHRVTRENETAISELSARYAELTSEINKFQNIPNKRDDVKKWREERNAIKAVIETRKEVIAKTSELTKKVEENEKAFAKQSKTQNSVKIRIKEVIAEMANLVNQAQQQGVTIDESSGRYRELAEELGRLKDIQGDVAAQAKVLSNDENQYAGVISGLSGLAGGFSAVQGAMALFGSENENLQKVMTQLQAVMAVTMGLQQVQQMLNKDSAFTLVTLNSLRSWWNNAMAAGTTIQAADNATTATAITLKEGEAAATTSETVAEEVNTTAQIENTAATGADATAKQAKAGAAGEAATAEVADTVATEANAVASEAGAVANFTLAGAFRAVGLAIKSIPVVGWILAGIAGIIALISHFTSANEEADKELEEQNELLKESRKAYAQAKGELSGYINKIENFKGTQKEEKRLVEELNSKYGEEMGYHKSLSEWKDTLASKGESYCKALEKEALAQAYLNKYTEAYINLLEVQQNVKAGKYHSIWNTKRGDQKADKEAEDAAKAEVDKYLAAYETAMQEATNIRRGADLGGHTDPSKNTGSTGSAFDPKEAARKEREAREEWKQAMIEYIKQANKEVTQANIESMAEGMEREIATIQEQTKQKAVECERQILELGKRRKQAEKAIYLSKKGHTEEGWLNSDRGKISDADYANEILNTKGNEDLKAQYYARLSQITEQGESQVAAIRKKYRDQWIKDFGTDEQKQILIAEEWEAKLAKVLLEAPELYEQVVAAMEKDAQSLDLSKFKLSINWDDVFGDLGEQSLSSISFTLDKVKTYFEQAKGSMSVTEIKDFQEAITRMEDEIASRNPFTALHKSFTDISTAKTSLVTALEEYKSAQEEVNASTEEHNRLMDEKRGLIDILSTSKQNDEIFALEQAQQKLNTAETTYQQALQNRATIQARIDSGELAANCQELADANNAVSTSEQARTQAIEERNIAQSAISDTDVANAAIALVGVNEQLAASTTRISKAQTNNVKAEQNVVKARNNVTKSYKQFATNLRAAGGVISDIGGKAKSLAKVFSADVADGIDKAMGFIDEMLDATTNVISAIGDVGKNVAKGMSTTVDAMGQSTKATAAATATSISTVEKASVILAVISAALQIATAIANLIGNGDEDKQKEIDKLQGRIDQLQWELDNQETVTLQQNTSDAVLKLQESFDEVTGSVMKMWKTSKGSLTDMDAAVFKNVESQQVYQQAIQKVADYWSDVDYSANKALGTKKYENSRKQIENLAEQQALMYKQMQLEQDKKDKDESKIQDYKNKIAELANDMANIINEMLEDIVGASAEDLAKTLGDAFFDAVSAGEDAMEAWRKKTNEIVADIIKRMMITQFLEPRIAEILDKYKKEWFKNGVFQGADAVRNSADKFASDIYQAGEDFNTIYSELNEGLKKYYENDATREGTSKGIATASQESVDENNARLTTIQSHTYSIMQGVAILNDTANAMLDRLTGIEDNTTEANAKLEQMDIRIKRVGDTLETIQTNGLRIK